MNRMLIKGLIRINQNKECNTLTNILFKQIHKNDVDKVYEICKKNDMLNSFSIALMLNGLLDRKYYNYVLKYGDDINYRLIDESLWYKEDYLSKEDTSDVYLSTAGITATYDESKPILRKVLYFSIVDNKALLERFFKAIEENKNTKALVELEDIIEIRHRNKKKVLTKKLK